MAGSDEKLSADILVIGSGAGGAITACTLAEAGRDVLILEEGRDTETAEVVTHSPQAMQSLYRNGGLNPILGKPSIAFVEGCCVGGSTEINSAFWHRLPDAIAEGWRERYKMQDFSPERLAPLFSEIEEELKVQTLTDAAPPKSSEILKKGADALNWKWLEVKRAQEGRLLESAYAAGAKRSMKYSYLPRAIKAGARLKSLCRVDRILQAGGRVTGVRARVDGHRDVEISAKTVFVCGGAIQTPLLLRRSGIKRKIGDSLRMHIMLKCAAAFGESLNSHETCLPIYQVHEFAPDVTVGGSVFTRGFLALTLTENGGEATEAMADWRKMGLYYTSIRSQGLGTIRQTPFSRSGLIRYTATEEDQRLLNRGFKAMCRLLLAGGAERIYPGVKEGPVIRSESDLETLPELDRRRMSLSVLHVMGSCPMGETSECATDSFGRVKGYENLRIADASLLPEAPGVNPQGTVMAIACRTARHFLDGGIA